MRIWRHFGPDAVKMIEEDPYRLAREVRGIGFEGADEIAAKFGVDPLGAGEAPGRHHLRAGGRLADGGHTVVPRGEIAERAARLLGVDADAVVDAIAEAIRHGDVEEVTVEAQPCLAARRSRQAGEIDLHPSQALAVGARPGEMVRRRQR